MRDRLFRTSRHNLSIRGIHCDFEWSAYRFLKGIKHPLQVPFWEIRFFSLYLGPDIRWFFGMYPASWSRYNPSLGVGTLPEAITKMMEKMRVQLTSRRRVLRSAPGMLAHLAVDACDPAHHTGKPGKFVTRIGPIAVSTDWDDPLTGSLRNPEEKHNHFERDLGQLVRDYGNFHQFLGEVLPLYQNYSSRLVSIGAKQTTIEIINEIQGTGIWKTYTNRGWSSDLARYISSWLFPRTIAFLAALWGHGARAVSSLR